MINFSKILFFFLLVFYSAISIAQRIPDKVLDTFAIRTGKIILYENNKWTYVEETMKDTVKPSTGKTYFDSEMLINQGKTPYQKKQDNGNKKNDGKTKGFGHPVKKGDSLISIAIKYKTTVENLCKLNNISKNSTLNIGQKIKVR